MLGLSVAPHPWNWAMCLMLSSSISTPRSLGQVIGVGLQSSKKLLTLAAPTLQDLAKLAFGKVNLQRPEVQRAEVQAHVVAVLNSMPWHKSLRHTAYTKSTAWRASKDVTGQGHVIEVKDHHSIMYESVHSQNMSKYG